MTATRVSYSTLSSQPWQNVYDVVNTRTNVADPLSISGRKFVYSFREPDVNATGFQGFPYVIVKSPSYSPSRQTVNRKSAQQDFVCELEIVTCDRGRNENDALGPAQMAAITDDVLQTFSDVTIRNSLRLNGLLFSFPSSSPVVAEPFKNTLVYRRVVSLPFKTRMPVSA